MPCDDDDDDWGLQATVRVPDEQVEELLKSSGKNGIFVRRPWETTAPAATVTFWFKGLKLEEMTKHAAATKGAQGLVRGRKSIGIRIDKANAETAYQALERYVFPVRIDAVVGKVWIIKGCPPELEESRLIAYMKDHKDWDISALGSRRRHGLREWTVAAKAEPGFQETNLKVNDTPCTVLVQPRDPAASAAGPGRWQPPAKGKGKGKGKGSGKGRKGSPAGHFSQPPARRAPSSTPARQVFATPSASATNGHGTTPNAADLERRLMQEVRKEVTKVETRLQGQIDGVKGDLRSTQAAVAEIRHEQQDQSQQLKHIGNQQSEEFGFIRRMLLKLGGDAEDAEMGDSGKKRKQDE